jgi:hypothetical protein
MDSSLFIHLTRKFHSLNEAQRYRNLRMIHSATKRCPARCVIAWNTFFNMFKRTLLLYCFCLRRKAEVDVYL